MRKFRLRYDSSEVCLSAGTSRAGRGGGCEIVIRNGMVSRVHAEFELSADGLTVRDLGSRNGVYVNDEQLRDSAASLDHGDSIRIGLTELVVVADDLMVRPEHLSTLPPLDDGVECATETKIDVLRHLSKREREVFELIVRGHPRREVACLLGMSVKTFDVHQANIKEKLESSNRADLVGIAVDAGVLK